VRFGLFLNTPPAWQARRRFETTLEMAVRAQAHGFDAVVVPQHYADTNQRLLQPLPMLGRLAGAVDTIAIGTGILLAGLLNPYEVAEGLATVDVLSGGRALLGVGAGHQPNELAAFGCTMAERGRRLEQCVTDVRTLWSSPTYGDLAPTVTAPISLPPTRPIPIWVAGTSDAGVRRAARVGDAWYAGPGADLATIDRQVGVYTAELARWGREMPAILPIRRDVFLTTGPADRERLGDTLARRHAAQRASGYQGDLPAAARAARAGLAESGSGWAALAGPEVIAGNAEECAAQLAALAGHLPAEPLVVLRVAWPAIDPAGLLARLDAIGELTRRLAATQTTTTANADSRAAYSAPV
jgi:alkanesulfonate monooxygenase SsuD/methylene tetrahydromethanopterin reductase-like flavin-dependent oxidoreductase (luciferase family)